MPQRDHPSPSSNLGSEPKKAPEVLIVEQEKLLRLMMAKLLQVSGYQVYTCGDGLQALQLIKRRPFDLIITDLMLEGADGLDLLKTARSSQPDAKVIITTYTPSSHTLLEAKYEGAHGYLRKPFQLKHFLSILKDAIDHSRLRYGYQYQGKDGREKSEYETL